MLNCENSYDSANSKQRTSYTTFLNNQAKLLDYLQLTEKETPAAAVMKARAKARRPSRQDFRKIQVKLDPRCIGRD